MKVWVRYWCNHCKYSTEAKQMSLEDAAKDAMTPRFCPKCGNGLLQEVTTFKPE